MLEPPASPDRRHKDLFAAAIDLPGPQRAEFVQKAAGSDRELLRRVERLLEAHDLADRAAFLPAAAAIAPPDGAAAAASALTGTRIGPYRLGRLLGEGGFGRVYLAEQEEPFRRVVAIKVLQPGMDNHQVLVRFEAERQALALMDHPGIASILDAGTMAAGQPYFVMEFVDGLPVTSYCEAQALELRERLELFERICHAVHHAHQKGVIHRDLKPTNVLVTERDGVALPKVIDFGIAKAVDLPSPARTQLTAARQILGTPQYMSPEQARIGAIDIDTRSDIYSLGVLLYELLTGLTPHGESLRRSGGADVQRILEQEAPQRPSLLVRDRGPEIEAHAGRLGFDPPGLARVLRDDLDWIVLKALEKDRSRRYDSAAAFARDVRRHLDHQPVQARRPATAYLLWKFVQRNQVAATAIFAASAALLLGLVFAMFGLAEASQQRDLARAQLRDLYVAQARAFRSSAAPGRRTGGLEALQAAAAIRTSDDLRDEAIACLCLPDIEFLQERELESWPVHFGPRQHDLLATAAGGVLAVVAAGSGQVLATLREGVPPLHTAVFSRHGHYLAVSHQDRSLAVYDLGTAQPVFELPAGRLRDHALAFDGRVPPAWFAVAEADGKVHVRSLPAGALLHAFPAPAGAVVLAAAADGSALAVTSDDPAAGLLVFDLVRGAPRLRCATPDGSYAIDWSRDGRFIATAADMVAYLFDAADGTVVRVLRGHQGAVVMVAFDPLGDIVATSAWDNTVRLWWTETGEPVVGPLRGHRLVGVPDQLMTRRRDAVASWRIERGHELRRARSEQIFGAGTCQLAVHDAGGWFATAGRNGLWIWDQQGLHPVLQLASDPLLGVRVAAGGRFLVAASRADVWSFELLADRPLSFAPRRLLGSHEVVQAIDVGSNPAEVLVIARDGVHRFDPASGAHDHLLPGYPGMATPPAPSPDGRWLFTGTWKGEPAAVWDLRSASVACRFPGIHVIGCFTPDGRHLLVSDQGEQICYETTSWRPVYSRRRDESDALAGAIAIAADGGIAAVSHSRYATRLVEPGSGRVLGLLEHPDGVATGDLAFADAGRTLLVLSPEHTLLAWDLRLIRERLQALGLDWEKGR